MSLESLRPLWAIGGRFFGGFWNLGFKDEVIGVLAS